MWPKVEYSLTEFGKTLIPVISALGNWSDEHQLLPNNHFSMFSSPFGQGIDYFF
ncbi:winged helix-turn-helix transcriptional regulator [Sphingobacterium sp. 40-24]|uniref:winged helix-turn-helix transcriptional regulator n=1 Tax=Sphingobacterium sp. 40-24 TaxID=1895843 RepID=UPI00257AAC8B|nr:winged helix-turn-helix transcriptional regulator [Sphingobacterium sp. 40-24]